MMIFSHQSLLPKPEGICFYCGKGLKDGQSGKGRATWDHSLPTCRGGVTLPANLLLACAACNSDKGALTLEEYREYHATIRNFNARRTNQAHVNIVRWKFAGERVDRAVMFP